MTASTLSTGALARNTLWNFVGAAVAAPVALVAIPPLLAALGQDLFGLLTIAWTVLAYFSLFDFGLGRATTKYLAEAAHARDTARVAQLFWTSLAAHVALGLAGGAILFALASPLVSILTIPDALRDDAILTLRILALSIPPIVVTACARGTLEAIQRFDLVNAVKIPGTAFTYLGPLALLPFTHALPPIVVLIGVGRVIVLAIYLVMCVRVLPAVRRPRAPHGPSLRPLAFAGGWFTVTTLIPPFIASFDRFVVGSAVAVGAVASYGAAYEVVTKLWIFSASLLGVLFPAFSIVVGDEERLQRLYGRAVAALFVFTTPVVGIVVAFAPEFFTLWLGEGIGPDAAVLAQLLAAGVLVNVIAQVPWTTLQATGHADVTAHVQLAELPVYAVAAWYAATRWGAAGVAIVWSLRAAVDAVLLFAAASRRLPGIHAGGAAVRAALAVGAGAAFLLWCWKGTGAVGPGVPAKTILVLLSAAGFLAIAARHYALDPRKAFR